MHNHNNNIATLQLHPYTAPGPWEAFVSITWNYKEYNITTRKRNDRLKRRYRQLQIEQENTAICASVHPHSSQRPSNIAWALSTLSPITYILFACT